MVSVINKGESLMANFVLSCCSTSDLTEEHYLERDIKFICFHFFLDGKEYSDDLGKSVSFKDFYQAMREDKETKTSQVNVDEFVTYFEKFLKDGKDIIHVTLSSGLSGVLNSANIAKEMLESKYPDRKIYVVDSLGASSGYGLFMDKLADLRDEGKSIDQIKLFAETNKLYLNHWFFSTDLKYYVKGGRISKMAGLFGTVLHVCPILNMNNEGKLIPRKKILTKKKAIPEIVDLMEKDVQNGLDYDGKCYICHSDCYEDARAVADLVESKFKKLNGKVEIYSVGTTIGSHTGPGTVALFFWGVERGL